MKAVTKVFQPRAPHFVGDGFRVHNFIPSYPELSAQNMDPFLMLDYNSKYVFPPSEIPKGVGVHPHKGFETVTIAYKGRVEHGDSSGGGGVIGEGDIQWMTAASGVLHKEFHETEWSKDGGVFQMIQLWVNLPAKDKKTAPKYQAIANTHIPKVVLTDGSGEIEVIAGNYQTTQGAADTFTPISMYNLKAKAGAKVPFDIPEHYNTFVLVLEGSITVNGDTKVATDELALMSKIGSTFDIEVHEDAVVFIAGGAPINEPIVHYGPFVMNTIAEIHEAIDEFESGKYGQLQ